MTVEDDGRPKHVGRVFGVPDSYFCVARQRDQLLAQNIELTERIKRMEEAALIRLKAKEAKP